MLTFRVNRIEEHLADINDHGSKPMLAVRAEVDAMRDDFREIKEAVSVIPLLQQDVERYLETFKAMRTSLYSVAGAILIAAIAVLLLGGGH